MNDQRSATYNTGFVEFVLLLALTMSLVALSIDAMLPGLPHIAETFGVVRENYEQFVITALFAGLSVGQLLAGPISDSLGRKKAIYIGLVFFILGSLLAYFSTSYEMLLAGRFIQGLGAAAPRIVTIAIVRDRYEGRDMARVMSYIMGVFIFVPAIAPTMGQAVMMFADWRAVFLVFIALAVAIFLWISARLTETLHPQDVRPFTVPVIWNGLKTVCSNRMTVCYMIAAGFVFGAFIGYLNSSQLIFQNYYAVGEMFPLFFALTALPLGAAFFVNARLVKTYGMRMVILWALIAMAGLAVAFVGFELWSHMPVPLPVFMVFMIGSAFCMGMCFGNFNALAMVPMGHLAGMASSVIGCVSLVVSMVSGGIIGQMYDGSLMPVSTGFLVLSSCSLLMMYMAERGVKPPPQGEATA